MLGALEVSLLKSSDVALLDRIGLSSRFLKAEKIAVKEVQLKQGDVIFKSGDACRAFLILTSGQLRVDITIRSGRDIILYRMEPEETCIMTTSALLNNENYYTRGIAETDLSAMAISAADFSLALRTSSEFSQYILANFSKRMSLLIRLLDKVASKDILYELCCLLLSRCDDDNMVYLKQDALAKEIGTAREVVSRKLSVLEEQGLLRTQRGKIHLLDIPHLESLVRL